MNRYSNRRMKILKNLQGNAAIMLHSGKEIMASEDEAYPFRVNRNFYYLTGLDKEDMVLLMYNIDGNIKELLFIQPYDESLARWVGGRLSKQQAKDISEVENVHDISELDFFVSSLLNRTRRDTNFRFYFDFWHYKMDQENNFINEYANKLKAKYPYIILKDLYPILTHLRLVKDEYEIACLKKAISITNQGIQQMMRSCKPGNNEMSMEGIFDFVLKQSLCKQTAFKTIAASGSRATILHYSENDQVMKDGELFLCDLGATYDYYNADISRTFPVNGRFTSRQKELYEIVLNAQKMNIL